MTDIDLNQLIETLETHQKYLSDNQAGRLLNVVRFARGDNNIAAGTTSIMGSLRAEVQEQLEYVQGFRRRVVARGDEATTRELKDMLQASTSLFTMLTKMDEDITNQDRLRKVENAVVEMVKTLDVKSQQVFYDALEEALSA